MAAMGGQNRAGDGPARARDESAMGRETGVCILCIRTYYVAVLTQLARNMVPYRQVRERSGSEPDIRLGVTR